MDVKPYSLFDFPGDERALHEALQQCARHPPEPMMPAHLTWGHDRAAHLVHELPEALHGALQRSLATLWHEHDSRSVWLAAVLSAPDTVDLARLERALSRGDALGEGGLVAVRALWCSVVGDRLPWSESYRPWVDAPWGGSLLGTAMVWDRDWAVAQLDSLLGQTLRVSRFASAVLGSLRASEALWWRQRVAGLTTDAPALVAAIDHYLVRAMLPTGPVRWQSLPSGPISWERRRFCDVDGLFAAACASLEQGRWRAIGRDVEEPALAWMDRLATHRSDWHGALAQCWRRLLEDDDPVRIMGSLEALAMGPCTGLFLDVLRTSRIQTHRIEALNTPPRAVLPRQILDRHEPVHKRLTASPVLWMMHGPTRILRLSTADDLQALAQECVIAGESLSPGSAPGIFRLDWLQFVALFNPWVQAQVVPVLAALVDGDGIEAVAEYLFRSGDRRYLIGLIPLLRGLDSAVAEREINVPYAPVSRFSELADWLETCAEQEWVTGPKR